MQPNSIESSFSVVLYIFTLAVINKHCKISGVLYLKKPLVISLLNVSEINCSILILLVKGGQLWDVRTFLLVLPTSQACEGEDLVLGLVSVGLERIRFKGQGEAVSCG